MKKTKIWREQEIFNQELIFIAYLDFDFNSFDEKCGEKRIKMSKISSKKV